MDETIGVDHNYLVLGVAQRNGLLTHHTLEAFIIDWVLMIATL